MDDILPYFLTIVFFLILLVLNLRTKNLRRWQLYVTVGTVLGLIWLEGRFAYRIEKGRDDDVVRINPTAFEEDPFAELGRYATDVKYYNNFWRIALICASAISLFIFTACDLNPRMYPYVLITTFALTYHIFHYKIHHSYDFVFRTLQQACHYASRAQVVVPEKPFIPERHP